MLLCPPQAIAAPYVRPLCRPAHSFVLGFGFFLDADCKLANGWTGSKEPGPDLSATAQKHLDTRKLKIIEVEHLLLLVVI